MPSCPFPACPQGSDDHLRPRRGPALDHIVANADKVTRRGTLVTRVQRHRCFSLSSHPPILPWPPEKLLPLPSLQGLTWPRPFILTSPHHHFCCVGLYVSHRLDQTKLLGELYLISHLLCDCTLIIQGPYLSPVVFMVTEKRVIDRILKASQVLGFCRLSFGLCHFNFIFLGRLQRGN
jgi:hypothetical protein